MTTIIFKQKDGEIKSVDAENGLSLMVAAVENDITGIKAICNGCCSCGTCHVTIDVNFQHVISPMYSGEKQVLNQMKTNRENSRLACQIIVDEKLEGMSVRVN
jgi:2Fe-2S ferredoxin